MWVSAVPLRLCVAGPATSGMRACLAPPQVDTSPELDAPAGATFIAGIAKRRAE